MIAQSFTLVLLAVVAVSTAVVPEKEEASPVFKPMENIDPNDLSCDSAGQIFLLLPHFVDCTKFYMCENGKETEFNCAPGTRFDFELQGCDHEWNTECKLRDPKDDDDGSGDDDILGMYGDETENGPLDILTAESSGTVRPISAIIPHQFNNILNCQRADDASRLVAYKSDCQRYWKCVSGVPQIVYCSDGLFFNSQTQQCDFEANVRCSIDPVDELTGEFIVYE